MTLKPAYIVLPALVIIMAMAGAWATGIGLDSGWYEALNKPDLVPPNYVFGPVWTFIYILLSVALISTWSKRASLRWPKLVAGIFIYNALVNVLWSWAFFAYGSLGVALWLATEIWASVLVLIILLWPKHRLAAYCLVPYLLWVTLAIYLNYAIWLLN